MIILIIVIEKFCKKLEKVSKHLLNFCKIPKNKNERLPFKKEDEKKYQENIILQKIGTCIIFRNCCGSIKCIENGHCTKT